ncbi:hypothetical protein FKR81_41540 [Lentzea tibetensis]|uniref:Uncharacterized protein n=1 Tax=Lentzea tibetensis TaxID=2591470 RepID=A0A563EFL7_9PSEU|nr:hypothetical protein [Lentzea tibetensis]TWP44174.1 hypothetical protein FKR81_41540 [Lentzea tibetensis]
MAAPVLVHHWADGDLVVGSEIVEVKTVLRLDQVQHTVQWLWQLLAYAWLDTADRYRIGLYLARYGVLLSWGATTFADHLLGHTGAAPQARDEFLALAREVIAREGADPPGAWTPRLHRFAGHVAPTPEP